MGYKEKYTPVKQKQEKKHESDLMETTTMTERENIHFEGLQMTTNCMRKKGEK